MQTRGTESLTCSLTGFYTRYDSSSGDIAPLGSLGKDEIRRVVQRIAQEGDDQLFEVISE